MKKLRLFSITIACLFLATAQVAVATFTLSGTTITQSGTDTNLSGLSGIAGVTTNTFGNGDLTYTIYSLSNLGIDVTGTLTIDPRFEMIVWLSNAVEPAIDILSGGTLYVGQDLDINGYITQTTGIAINIADEDQGGGANGRALEVQSGGTLNWRGATIRMADTMYWHLGSNIIIKNGKLDVPEANNFRLRSYVDTGADIDGFEIITDTFAELDVFRNYASFKGYFPQGAVTQFPSAGSSGTDEPYIVRDLNAAGISAAPKGDLSIFNGAEVNLINPAKSTPITASIDQSTIGLVQIFKEFNLTVTDSSGTAIQSAKYYFTDYDNGGRVNQIPRNATDYDLLTDKIYSGTSDASGVFLLQTVLTATIGDGIGVNTVRPIEYRSKNNDWSSDFDIPLISYNHSISIPEQSLTGAGSLDWSWILIDDPLITELDKTVTDAYIQQDTAAKAYDHLKAILVDNYKGETSVLATRQGTTLYTNYAVIIDAAPNGPPTFDGTTITLHADTFTGNIETTSTVTLINGAVMGGYINDINGQTTIIRFN